MNSKSENQQYSLDATFREVLGIPALETKIDRIEETLAQLQPASQREWWDLKSCCIRKGLNYNTVKGNRALQPCGGKGHEIISGRRYWHWSVVENWLMETDNE